MMFGRDRIGLNESLTNLWPGNWAVLMVVEKEFSQALNLSPFLEAVLWEPSLLLLSRYSRLSFL